jgi:hypothetical protein
MELWLEWIMVGVVFLNLALITYIVFDIVKRLKRIEEFATEYKDFMKDVESAFARVDEFNEQLKELMVR